MRRRWMLDMRMAYVRTQLISGLLWRIKISGTLTGRTMKMKIDMRMAELRKTIMGDDWKKKREKISEKIKINDLMSRWEKCYDEKKKKITSPCGRYNEADLVTDETCIYAMRMSILIDAVDGRKIWEEGQQLYEHWQQAEQKWLTPKKTIWVRRLQEKIGRASCRERVLMSV